jgi:U3 small nucleolar RNA-associated protein 19
MTKKKVSLSKLAAAKTSVVGSDAAGAIATKKKPVASTSSSSTAAAPAAAPAPAPEVTLTEAITAVCTEADSFADLKRRFAAAVVPALRALARTPLRHALSENTTVLSCCDPKIAEARALLTKYTDVRLLTLDAAADTLQYYLSGSRVTTQQAAMAQRHAAIQREEQLQHQREAESAEAAAAAAAAAAAKKKTLAASARRRRRTEDETAEAAEEGETVEYATTTGQEEVSVTPASTSTLCELEIVAANLFALLYGVAFTTNKASVSVACAALVREKTQLESSDAYANTNAAERKRLVQNSVLSVFSDRGHRHIFSQFWMDFITRLLSDKAMCTISPMFALLRLHMLTDASICLVPHLTNPLLLSDVLTSSFSAGGLTAALALQSLLHLMLHNGLEYPNYFRALYSLITPDAFVSRHRYTLFHLLRLSLGSLRVPAATAAAFIKRLARSTLLSPTPVLYFTLPFIRRLLQQHPNTLALIHRTVTEMTAGENDATANVDGEGEEAEADPELAAAARARVRQLFDGVDPFDNNEADPQKSHALQSTLWEVVALERHWLPAAANMVLAYSSPAEDTMPLQVERSYARMFAQMLSKPAPAGCSVIGLPQGANADNTPIGGRSFSKLFSL